MNWLPYLSNYQQYVFGYKQQQQQQKKKKKKKKNNQRTLYGWVNISDDLVYESIFSKARYMNEVGFEILARTPVAQLPPSYPPSPTPEYRILSVTNLLS